MEKDLIEMNSVPNDEIEESVHHHHHHHHSHSSRHSHRKHKHKNSASSSSDIYSQYSKTKTVKLWKRILFTGVGVVIIGTLLVMLFAPHDSAEDGCGTIFNIVHEG